MDTIKKGEIQVNDETYDYGSDFKVLPEDERREIMKTAKNLLKVQQGNAAMLADALPLKDEGQEKI